MNACISMTLLADSIANCSVPFIYSKEAADTEHHPKHARTPSMNVTQHFFRKESIPDNMQACLTSLNANGTVSFHFPHRPTVLVRVELVCIIVLL